MTRFQRPIHTALLLAFLLSSTGASPDCETSSTSDVDLQNTYWKLVTLGDEPVTVEPGHREPHFVLALDKLQVRGHGGCNRFSGRYRIDGDRLHFASITSSHLECREGSVQEGRFFQVMRATERFEIRGEGLELFGPEGSLARFRAVYFE